MSGLWKDLLPTSVDIDGTEYEIRSDYRAALDICMAMSDAELDEQDKAFTMLDIFYPSFDDMPTAHYQQAIERCLWFINCGEEETERQHIKLMDWEQDFKYIVAPINRVTGTEIRSIEYMHWWTFIAAYYEIGDCTFAQIVRIRDKKARGKPLDKTEQDWYRKNRNLVDLKTKYTQEDDEILRLWGG